MSQTPPGQQPAGGEPASQGPGTPATGSPPDWGRAGRRRRRADGGQGWWGPPDGRPGAIGPWTGPPPWTTNGPWGQPGWNGPPRRWFLRRFAGLVIGLLLFVVLLAAIGGFVFASILGLLGPDRPGQEGATVVIRLGGVAVIILGLVAVVSRIRTVAGPIDEMVEATRRVGSGDYAVRVRQPRRGPRELGELAAGFNTMAERLEVDERQRRSLLADVSHELRNPLAVVRGNLEAIIDGVHPADQAHLASILDETLVLGRLVEDLRTVALSEAGTLALHREPTDLGLLIHEAARSFETMAAAASVGVNVSPSTDAPELPVLDVDPVRIREVLDNLIANALRYTPPGGTVTIEAGRAPGGRSVNVSVSDTGSGIAPEIRAHLFERFAKTGDSRGSGLGLAIARNLVEAHGGSIAAEGRPGGGTRIRFSLPVGDQPAD
ncbi:MAG: sensor histidine kinase [Candidatus Limnocylindrales bacterium]